MMVMFYVETAIKPLKSQMPSSKYIVTELWIKEQATHLSCPDVIHWGIKLNMADLT